MMKWMTAAVFLLLGGGCATHAPAAVSAATAQDNTTGRPEVKALYTTEKMTVDGRLDEAIWKQATAYPLRPNAAQEEKEKLQEGGEIRVAWDEANLYVALRFVDSDVVADGTRRNEWHFEKGDTGEVFLKPLGDTYYWELYATPRSKTSTFFFPGRTRRTPSSFAYRMSIHVAGKTEGTLNHWQDRDAAWTAEMAVPRRELERYGAKVADGAWSILGARYNYGRYLNGNGPELSMHPCLPQTNFHLLEHYAVLRLLK